MVKFEKSNLLAGHTALYPDDTKRPVTEVILKQLIYKAKPKVSLTAPNFRSIYCVVVCGNFCRSNWLVKSIYLLAEVTWRCPTFCM